MYVCPIFRHIMYGDQLTMKEWERVKEIEVLVVNKSVCTLLPQGSYYTTHSGVCVCVWVAWLWGKSLVYTES